MWSDWAVMITVAAAATTSCLPKVKVAVWVWSRSMMLPTHDKLPFPYCSAIQTTASEVAVPASLRLGPAGERPNCGGKGSTELLARLGLACLIPK